MITVRKGRISDGHLRALVKDAHGWSPFRVRDVETGEEYMAQLTSDVERVYPDSVRENPPTRQELLDALSLLCNAFSTHVRNTNHDPTKVGAYTNALNVLGRDLPVIKRRR